MQRTPTAVPHESAPAATPRHEQHLLSLRFLEALRGTLAGCGSEVAIYSSAVHRVAASLDLETVALAAYDPIAGTISVLHAAGKRRDWDSAVLHRVLNDGRTALAAGVLAVPIFQERSQPNEGPLSIERRPWGALLVARDADNGFSQGERQMLRSAAGVIGAELDRRRLSAVDDVLDALLRKTKPIDVYTHTLRELRRFIRYDHSASVMTMQRGMAQLTIRAEKVVGTRGNRESLIDSSRRGRAIRLTVAQTRYLSGIEEPFRLTKTSAGARMVDGLDHPDAAGLWHVFGLQDPASDGDVLCYPLVFGGQPLGVLRLAARRPDAFQPMAAHVGLIGRFARLLAVTLYRSELYHQSDRQLQAIKQIGRTITEPIPVDEICQQVLQLALRVLHVPVGVVGLLNDAGKVELVAHQGCTQAEPPVLGIREGIVGSAMQTGESRAVPNVDLDPRYVVFNARVRSELVAPITYNREVIGFLDVESFEEGRFREEDEEVITFLEALANQAAIAIKTAQLHFEALRRLGSALAVDAGLSTAGLQDWLIDELRTKNEQLEAANQRLARANQAKTEFLAHMSHDLRGPLNVIVGLANLLTDPSVGPALDPEKQRESLEVIRSSGEVLGSLIGNILDLSALEAGKVTLDLVPVDAQTAFTSLATMAVNLAEESHRELEIALSIDPDITLIRVDEQKFMRIMINLISNAVKFTPSGGRLDIRATAEVEARETGDMEGILHVVVADTGVGIPQDQHESIFDPFQRVERQPIGQQHGSGLGLAVVRQLVELHGGSVWVESAPGQGSSFHLQLPDALAFPAAEDHALHTEPGAIIGAAPVSSKPSRGLILVVEDTDDHMNMMRLAVTSRGYAMQGVGSGEDAIAWLVDHRPDVILLDMQLPGIDGFEVAAYVKGQVETHSIPLIAVTADALSMAEERARASGCDAYLTKPIDIARLLATIETVAVLQ